MLHNAQFGHDAKLDMQIRGQILEIGWSFILNIYVYYLNIFSVCRTSHNL